MLRDILPVIMRTVNQTTESDHIHTENATTPSDQIGNLMEMSDNSHMSIAQVHLWITTVTMVLVIVIGIIGA